MKSKRFSVSLRGPGRYLLGPLVFLLLLAVSACGSNTPVRIYDNAGVLNSSKVQRAATDLSRPVAIYTTSTFQGTRADFQRTALQKLNGNSDLIVMAIDTNSRYIYIARGSNVPLSGSSINQAVNSFAGRFNNGDYTNASVAALRSIHDSLNARNSAAGGFPINPLIVCCLFPALIVLFVVLFAASRRYRTGRPIIGGGLWNRTRRAPPGESQYYNEPDQGYGPLNQGYGPPPYQGRGMNPWAAGGLGAAAGGLAGYELGRREGERADERGNDAGGGDVFGGGGSFGGGNNPDNGDFGGGGNFGGSNNPDASNFDGGGSFGNSDFGAGGTFGGDNPDNSDFGGGGSFGGDSFGGGGDFGNDDSSGGGNF